MSSRNTVPNQSGPFYEAIPEFDREIANTRALLDRVPDEKLGWKPHEKSMTLGRLATHIADLLSFGASILQTDGVNRAGAAPPTIAASRSELLKRFDTNAAKLSTLIAETNRQRLSENWAMKFGERVIFEFPRVVALRTAMMNHLIHHRGQLTVYLRENDVPLPGLYGPSADEELARR